jgi:hypothetical protein
MLGGMALLNLAGAIVTWRTGLQSTAVMCSLLTVIMAFSALLWWERWGFRQILDAKDSEIDRLRRHVVRAAPDAAADRGS